MKKTTKKKKTDGRGGSRPGSGRKPGTRLKENPKDTMLTFRVSAVTARRIKELRELTKDDETPFVDILEQWVKEYASDYGIE